MASQKAEIVTKSVERVVVEKVKVITLELTPDEASALCTLVGRCAAYGVTSDIFRALDNLNLSAAGAKHYTLSAVGGGGSVGTIEVNEVPF